MIPLQIDRATSAPKSNATAGLTFAPAQSSTTDELFTGFLQRAADVASNPPASPDNSSDSTSGDSGASASNAATGGASNGGSVSPAAAKPNAANDNQQGPQGLAANEARSTTRNVATTNFGAAKRSANSGDGADPTRPDKTAKSSSDSKTSSHASSTSTDNSPATAPPSETPVVAVPVDSVKTTAETPKKDSLKSGGGTTADSASSAAVSLATRGAAGRQTAGQTASDAAHAAASATKPATNSPISGAAAQQAAASQATLPLSEKSTAIAPTRASRDATAAATGKSSSAVETLDQNTPSLAVSDQANLSTAEATTNALATPATTDLPSTTPLDGDAERAVQAALTAVAAGATPAPAIVKEQPSHASAATGDVGAVAGSTAAAGIEPTNSAGAFGDSAGDSTGSEGKAAASAKKTDGADDSGGVERVRFVQRVAKAFQTLGDQGGTLRLRLSPPELGTLKLEVSVRSGKMNAQVETDTPAARDLIVNNLPALRERLNDLNIQVEQFDVNVAGESASNMSGQSSQDNAYRQTGARTTNNLRNAASGESGAAANVSSASTPSGVNQLNVVV